MLSLLSSEQTIIKYKPEITCWRTNGHEKEANERINPEEPMEWENTPFDGLKKYKRKENKQRKKIISLSKKTILTFKYFNSYTENTWNHYGQVSTMTQSNRFFGMKHSCLSSSVETLVKTTSWTQTNIINL